MKYYLEQSKDYMIGIDVYIENNKDYGVFIDSYDPLIELEITDNFIEINNGFNQYGIPLEDHRDDGYIDKVVKVVTCKRKPIYHADIDVVDYEDYDHVTIWSL